MKNKENLLTRQGMVHGWEGKAWVDHFNPSTSFTKKLSDRISIINGSSDLNTAYGLGMNFFLGRKLNILNQKDGKPIFASMLNQYSSDADMDVFAGTAGFFLTFCEFYEYIPKSYQSAKFSNLIIKYLDFVSTLMKLSLSHPVYLGFAHGLAGHLLTMENLRYCLNYKAMDPLIANMWQIMDSIDNRSKLVRVDEYCYPWRVFSLEDRSNNQSWCHGSSGITLAILNSAQLSENPLSKKVALKAKTTFINQIEQSVGSEIRPTFCCGNIGSLCILHTFFSDNPKTKKISNSLLKSIESNQNGFMDDGLWYGSYGQEYLMTKLKNPALPMPLSGIKV